VAIHSGFNYLLVKPVVAALAILLVLPTIIYAVFHHSERSLRDWLDEDLDSKVQLLELINSGTFLNSNAGRMLQTLRGRFRGEDLADMLCLCGFMANSPCGPRACCCCGRAASMSLRSIRKPGTSLRNLVSWNVRSAAPGCSPCVR